jgi:hypothetical protein
MWDLLTVLFIVSPVAPPVPHHAPDALWKPLKKIALSLEVVGEHERWIDDYRSELGYVRRHWRELAEAPALADCQNLPQPAIVKECRNLNHSYQRMLEARGQVSLYRQDAFREMLGESHRLGEIWGLVETATCPTQSWVCRRRALLQLRDKLGPEDYYTGTLPPSVPLWRFQLVER